MCIFGCNTFIPLMVHAFLMELVVYSYCDLLSGDIELNPGPLKCCPACNAPIYIRKKYCDCGYKRGRPICPVKDVNVLLSNESKKLTMQRKQQLESEEESRYRRECNKTASSKRRASETPEEANKRRKCDKMKKRIISYLRLKSKHLEENKLILPRKERGKFLKARKLLC